MEFKINFAFIVCVFFVVIFTISLIDEIVKAIRNKREVRNKRKNSVSYMAFHNLLDYAELCHVGFLVKEHGFPKEQVISKYADEVCEECAYKHSCANGFAPKCLIIDEEMLNKIYLSKIDSD